MNEALRFFFKNYKPIFAITVVLPMLAMFTGQHLPPLLGKMIFSVVTLAAALNFLFIAYSVAIRVARDKVWGFLGIGAVSILGIAIGGAGWWVELGGDVSWLMQFIDDFMVPLISVGGLLIYFQRIVDDRDGGSMHPIEQRLVHVTWRILTDLKLMWINLGLGMLLTVATLAAGGLAKDHLFVASMIVAFVVMIGVVMIIFGACRLASWRTYHYPCAYLMFMNQGVVFLWAISFSLLKYAGYQLGNAEVHYMSMAAVILAPMMGHLLIDKKQSALQKARTS